MYIKDDAYLTLINSDDRAGYVTGTVKTPIGHTENISDDNLITDTLSITNQCLNGTSFNLGTVYAAELSFTMITALDRYELYGADIELIYHIGEYNIPLGKYSVTEAYRVNNKVSIKACDAMVKFDEATTEDTTGSAYELLKYCCDKCGVELAQTQAEIDALPNASALYAILQERVETYRDAVASVAAVTCSFATIDRTGKLVLRQYSADDEITINNACRLKNAEYGDYTVKFRGVSGRFLAESNFYPYKYIEPNADGLILELGDVSIVAGTSDFKEQLIANTWEYVKDISYTPCNIKIKPNPALDLGDAITSENIGNKTGATAKSYVQYFQWNYRRPMIVKSMGDNPRLASVKAKQNGTLVNLEASVASKDLVVQAFTNAQAFEIKSTDEEIITMNFVATNDCRPIFIAEVQYELDLDGVVTFGYFFDGVEMTERRIYRYRCAGKDCITLPLSFDMTAGTRTTLKVMARVDYIASEKRESDAKQTTLINFEDAVNAMLAGGELKSVEYETAEPDTTPPTMTIAEGNISAVAVAQGIANAALIWDGTITLTEEIGRIAIEGADITVKTFKESVSTSTQTPTPSGITETIGRIEINNVEISISGLDTDIFLTDKVGNKLIDKSGNNLIGG